MNKIVFSTLLFIISISQSIAQYGDCSSSFDACSLPSFNVTPSGYGNVEEFTSTSNISNPSTNPNPSPGNSGCLLSGELNSTWLLITVTSNGTLEFSMGTGGTFNCFDWIMWPYDATACNDIASNTLPPVACNWNGACNGIAGMSDPANLPAGASQLDFENPITVTAGDQYVLCFSNFSAASTNVPLNFFGTANVSCGTTVGDTICEGDTAIIYANDGISYVWDNTTPGFISSTSNGDTAYVNPSISTSYAVVITFSGGGTLNDTADVLVIDSTIVSAGLDTVICNNEVLTLPANANNSGGYGLSYTWTPSTGLSNANSLNPTLTTSTDQTYYLTAFPTQYPQCTSNIDSVVITIDTNVTTPFVIGDSIVCFGDQSYLEVIGAQSVMWPDSSISTFTTFLPIQDTTINIETTNECGPFPVNVNVIVNPLPITNSSLDTTIAVEQDVELIVESGFNYVWHPGTYLSCNTCDTTTSTPVQDIVYYVEFTDTNGCKTTDTISINVEYFPVFIPNGFSPNNDGENDLLLVRVSGVQSIFLQIFDRNGDLMFETNNQNEGWDGTYKGKPVNSGVYIYNLEVQYTNNQITQQKGTITLFR